MQGEIEKSIAAYFEDEEHLHQLRVKLLNLEGYRRQSEIDREWSARQEEHDRKSAELKQQYAQEIRRMEDAHAFEVQKLQETSSAELQRVQQDFEAYQALVKKQMKEASQNKTELTHWQSGYGEIAAVYTHFSKLPTKQQAGLAGIFGGCASPIDFFFGAVQKGHLEQLWDYIRDELDAGELDEADVARLSTLFDFSFGAVNRSQYEKPFRRLTVLVGAAFDGDTMGRVTGSPQLGRVACVIFAGFAHAVTGRMVRRSLVRLE